MKGRVSVGTIKYGFSWFYIYSFTAVLSIVAIAIQTASFPLITLDIVIFEAKIDLLYSQYLRVFFFITQLAKSIGPMSSKYLAIP